MPKSLATRSADLVLGAMLFICLPPVYAASAPVSYTRLLQLKAPTIVESSPSYPGPYEASNLLDGDGQTEFASNGKGTNTFVEFEFKAPASLSGFRHV